MSEKLSLADDLETRENAVIVGLKKMGEHWKEILAHIQAIKSKELWRAKYKTYTDFLDKIGESSSITPRRIYELLRAQEVKIKLLNSVPKTSQNLRKTVEKMSTEALLETARKPTEERLPIVEIAAKQMIDSSPPTARAIAVAAQVKSEGRKPTDKKTWPVDCEGTPIPPPAWPFWDRRNEVQPSLNQISEIKCGIQKAKESGDALYSWIGTPAIDALQNAYTTISNAKLYAVCTKCEGWWDRMTGGGCSTCHNTGLISKHQYEVCSPKEIKTMREKQNRARV